MSKSHKRHILSFFHIVMINVIAVDSIRVLPMSASYGLSLVFFYVIAAVLFFIPSGLISAELGTGWPHTGGLYVWVREAFGHKVSLVAIWLNWVYNLAWYPTIMALVAGTSAYIFDPSFAENKLYIYILSVSIFWLATYLNCHGMKFSSTISTVGALVGTLIPMITIIILAISWLAMGKKLQIDLSWQNLFPSESDTGKLAFFSNVLFGLLGLEMVATHAQEMKNPKKDYPRAILVSIVIILLTIILSALAIALVVPYKDLNLVVGTLQAFSIFFNSFNIPWMIPVLAICIIIGGISGVSAWIIGPTKGVMVAGNDGMLPTIFKRVNKNNVPTGALLLQAVIVTILCTLFVLLPSVHQSFWVLSLITAQLALLVYIMLFATAIKLHHSKREVERSFKVPFGNFGMWLVCGSGIITSLFAIAVGFIPPTHIVGAHVLAYEIIVILGMVCLTSIPFVLYKFSNRA